jgi:tRNA threonylcarbamoyl adenosine modification protein YeaZ
VLVLVLDTATPAVTAAVARVSANAVEIVAERRTVDARAHAEYLAPQIAHVLEASGAAPADLRAVVAGTGPGPFTGLRVGLVSAAALGHALGIATYGVPSLDAIGAAAPVDDPYPVLVATDARRHEVYWSLHLAGGRIDGPAVDRPARVAAEVARRGVRRAYGDGALRYAGVLGLTVAAEPRYPPARELAVLAAQRVRAGSPSEALTPLYLRRPDATPTAERKAVLPCRPS